MNYQLQLKRIFEDAEFDDDVSIKVLRKVQIRLAKSGIRIPDQNLESILDLNRAGEGNSAIAYKFGDKVVKITSDGTDFETFIKIMKVRHPNLPIVYDAFSTKTKDSTGYPLYVIVVENIKNYPSAEYGNAMNILGLVLQEYGRTFYTLGNIDDIIRLYLEKHPDYVQDIDQRTIKSPAFSHLVDVLLSLSKVGVRPTDVQEQNWGMRGNEPVLYDLGNSL